VDALQGRLWHATVLIPTANTSGCHGDKGGWPLQVGNEGDDKRRKHRTRQQRPAQRLLKNEMTFRSATTGMVDLVRVSFVLLVRGRLGA
jgi:hypothetical protein